MAVFEDLSEYKYGQPTVPPTKNVGWLGPGRDFQKEKMSEELLDLLWQYCKVSVAEARGWEDCEFCPPHTKQVAERDGLKFWLGSAEIRVISGEGEIYAAPNLIYHYAAVHDYHPPQEFIDAMRSGPRPASQEYFHRLKQLGIPWHETPICAGRPVTVRFVKTPHGIERIEE